MSKLTPEDRVGASQVKSVGRLFFVEGTAQAKAWSADIRRHVPRRLWSSGEWKDGFVEVGRGQAVEGPERLGDVCMLSEELWET